MKTRLAVLALMVNFASTSNSVFAAEGYILKIRGALIPTRSLLMDEGITITSEIPELNMLVVDQLPGINSRAMSSIKYAAINGEVRTQDFGPEFQVATNTPVKGKAWWDMEQIHAPQAWKITTGNKNVIVAISDTGAWNHSQLTPNFWVNPGEVAKNKKDDDGNGHIDDINGWNAQFNSGNILDRHYHGTHVSGTVGAYTKDGKSEMNGVAWQVSLMEVPFIDASGSGSDADGIKTIVYAADNGARVLNASWGSDEENPAMKEAIEYAKSKGMLVVIAAGNDGHDNDGKTPSYPASFDSENIISVAATDSSFQIPSWSNWGAKSVDLAAPGEGIYSTWNPMNSPIRKFWYFTISGTSMATPHVAGAAALLFSVNPNLTWREAKDILLSTVTPRKSLKGKVLTGGELNVEAAVKRAKAMLK